MNPRIASAISLFVFVSGLALIGVGCALAIMPATVIGVFLVGAGVVGGFFVRR